ncbi:ParB N-terminal domain-containing protein [Paraherbaspirillum soli]|uniref:ParB N-terminal domain-containing protein n=1 Tax=Paraherbaspirillum soli TaxID=631222 RepID=A0ABW0M9S2_9BURK
MTKLKPSPMLNLQPLHLVRLDLIRPNEQHHPEHALMLADTILREQRWRVPVTLERHSLAVMDGHHRLEAARRLKLKLVPCLLLDYSQVEVSAWRQDSQDYLVTPQEIVRRSASGELYPPKTTRHRFPSPLPDCDISLSLLGLEGSL